MNKNCKINSSDSVNQQHHVTLSDMIPDSAVREETLHVHNDVPTYADAARLPPSIKIKNNSNANCEQTGQKQYHEKVPLMSFNREKFKWERNIQTCDRSGAYEDSNTDPSPK